VARSSNAPPKPRRPTVKNHSGQLLTSHEFGKMNLRQSLRYDRKVRKAARKYTKKRGAVTKGAGTRANQFAGADYRYTQARKAHRRARRDSKGRFR
jgi:hypothetical protein